MILSYNKFNPKFLVLLLLILILTGLTESNNQRVNEGASTSQERVSDEEKCDINTFVDNTLNLLTEVRNITRLNVDVVIRETQSIYFDAIGRYLKYGTISIGSHVNHPVLSNYRERERYYKLYVKKEAMETFMDSCNRYIRDITRETLNDFTNTVLKNFTDLILDKNRSNTKPKLKDEKNSEETTENPDLLTSTNHVIPLPLIFRFFEEWSDSFDRIPNNLFECTNAAGYNQISKAFSVANPFGSIRNLLTNSTNPNDLRRNLIASVFRGNIFRTPEPYIRDPYLLSFDRTSLQLLTQFEFDSVLILESERYQELLSLFNRLINYLREDLEEITAFERYTSGVELYILMMTTFLSYEPSVVDTNLLERRQMSEEELSKLNKWERDYYRDQLFWAIKKEDLKKSRRSVMQNKKETPIKPESNEWWSEFVNYLVTAFLQAQFSKKFMPWSDSFAHLYYFEYQTEKSSSNNCFNGNFDTFLHTKIVQLQESYDCFGLDEKNMSNELCQAWRNVATIFHPTNHLRRHRFSNFHMDLKKVFISLLKEASSYETEKSPNYGYVIFNMNYNLSDLEQANILCKVEDYLIKQP